MAPYFTAKDLDFEKKAMDAFQKALNQLMEDLGWDGNEEVRVNEDFEIILAQPTTEIGTEIVLGRRKPDGWYVTWMCQDGNNYFWGHYFNEESLLDAMRDFIGRCEKSGIRS